MSANTQALAQERPAVTQDYPRIEKAAFAIAILMVVTFQAQLDRQLPSLLVAPIRAAFDITDTQISFFQGAAFAVFYAVAGPMFGMWVDKSNRRNLIIAGVLAWSGMTLWSGFATTYWELLISRAGVGVGEAVLAPAAYSLIADYVAPRARGRALSIYMTSIAIGGAASLAIGGLVIGATSNGLLGLPLVNEIAPWRAAFLIVGAPGVIAALLMLLVREPERKEDGSVPAALRGKSGYGDFLRYVWTHRAAFLPLIITHAVNAFIAAATLPWTPTFFQRAYGTSMQTAGLVLGASLGVTTILAFSISGVLSDRWTARGDPIARLRPMILAQAAMVVMVAIWPLAGSAVVSFATHALFVLSFGIAYCTLPTTMQEIAPNRMRGQAVTLTLMVSTLLGSGAGTTATALVTDFVFHSDAALGHSIVAVGVAAALVGLVASLLAAKPFARTRTMLHDAPPAMP